MAEAAVPLAMMSVMSAMRGKTGSVKQEPEKDNPYMPVTEDEKALTAKRKLRKTMASRRGRASTINTMSDTLG